MFCSEPRHERTEIDLLRQSQYLDNASILTSLVEDLCFWDSHGLENWYGNDRDGIFGSESHRSGFWYAKKKKKKKRIPTMKEALDMDYISDNSSESSPFQSATWKTAIDAQSGKVYYYDAVSRKTQWKKPAELKKIEKEKKKEKRRVARLFFNEMEKNIMNSLSRGEVIPGIPFEGTKSEGPPKEPLPKSHVRTISAMYGVLLEELGVGPDASTLPDLLNCKPQSKESLLQKPKRQNSIPKGRPPLPVRGISHGKNPSSNNLIRQNSSSSCELKASPRSMEKSIKPPLGKESISVTGERKSPTISINGKSNKMTGKPKKVLHGPLVGHTRRNTEGTIYVEHTMTNPDVKATIKCVCGIFRAHIRQAIDDKNAVQKEKARSSLEFNVFDDDYGCSRTRRQTGNPTLEEISQFYEAFYQRSQMEHDTIIFSLIYIERLIKSTNGILAPTPQNWRSLLFSCMVMASKVWDDFSMWNYDFANVTAHTTGFTMFTISRINELELALLKSLKFNVKVPASEYAKYYFLIRNMLLGSGLVKEDKEPLGKRDGSEDPEMLNNPILGQMLSKETRDRRTKSMDGSILKDLHKEVSNFRDPNLKNSIFLEPVIRTSCKV